MREKMVELQEKKPMKSAEDRRRIAEEMKTFLANEAELLAQKTPT